MVNLTRLCVDIRDSHDDQRSTYGLRIRLQYPEIIGFIPKHNNFIRFWDGQNRSLFTGVGKCPILGILDITKNSSHLVDHIPIMVG